MRSALKKTLIFTGAAAAAGYLLYLLFRDDDREDESESEGTLLGNEFGSVPVSQARSAVAMSRNECLQLLDQIVNVQEKFKELLNEIVASMVANNFAESLLQVYTAVLPRAPADPLEQRGLTLFDLDFIVERYQNDPAIREYIARLMNMPQPDAPVEAPHVTPKQVVEIHEHMLEVIRELIKEVRAIPNFDLLDKKVITLVIQSAVSARVLQKFGVDHQQLDRAVMYYQAELSMNPHFNKISMNMQSEMSEITGIYN